MPKRHLDVCPPECRYMKGLFSFLILWLLSKKTIYPALKELKKRGLTEVKKEGRITYYYITEKGKRGPNYDFFNVCLKG